MARMLLLLGEAVHEEEEMKTKYARSSPRLAMPLLVAASTLVFAASAAWARHGPGPRGPLDQRCMQLIYDKHLKAYDTNKDGRLDHEEHWAMMQAKRAEALATYDVDGNGRLEEKELDKLHYDKLVEHFEEMDTNRDAEISRAEAEASCTPLRDHFDQADLDGNGSVSWSEFEKGAKKARGPHGHGPFPPPPPMHGGQAPPTAE